MARVSARPRPERERVLVPARQACPGCGGHMRLRYENRRTLVTLSGPVRLRLRIRRCEAPGCPRFHVPYRPEAEGALALPQHEFGLDVIALVGVLRQRGVILALDGLQPDVGHEVLWVVRDCLSGEVLLARSLLSATAEDLAPLL